MGKDMVERNIKLDIKTVDPTISEALAVIKNYPYIKGLKTCWYDPNDQSLNFQFLFETGLPSRLRETKEGVKAEEEVIFSFSSEYPALGPTIKLRPDFNRSLAHVQPGEKGSNVIPCLVDGEQNEFFHAEGLWSLLNQVKSWFDKAVANNLIDPKQGWEPIRRDSVKDTIVLDGRQAKAEAEKRSYSPFEIRALRFTKYFLQNQGVESFYFRSLMSSEPLTISDRNVNNLFKSDRYDDFAHGYSLGIFIRPGKDASGKRAVADTYQPDTVQSYEDLLEFASAVGCGENFTNALNILKKKLTRSSSDGFSFPVVFVFCVQRPFHLIGQASSIELIPYVVESAFPDLFTDQSKIQVYAASHRESIKPVMLKQISGFPDTQEPLNTTLIGCGSLGSKIAIHLARSGIAPNRLIDKNALSPHNAARHALLPMGGDGIQAIWLQSKANAVEYGISGLGQKTEAYYEDVCKAVADNNMLNQFFPNKNQIVINATAALSVRDALGSIAYKSDKARTLEASLFGNATLGFLSIEGKKRNPSTTDMIAEFYELSRSEPSLKNALSMKDMARQNIGEGCGSQTIVAPDSLISLFAASMSQKILDIQKNGFQNDEGELYYGYTDEEGMGIAWRKTIVLPLKAVDVKDSDWTVRISERAQQKMKSEVSKYPNSETGGVIVGRKFLGAKAFVVTDILDAPSDSVRTKNEFILGTKGLMPSIEEYTESANRSLYCLGTWHSHLSECGPSDKDYKAAKQILSDDYASMLILIKTPNSYHAIISKEESSSVS